MFLAQQLQEEYVPVVPWVPAVGMDELAFDGGIHCELRAWRHRCAGGGGDIERRLER